MRRRTFVAAPFALRAAEPRRHRAAAASPVPITISALHDAAAPQFDPSALSTVGIYDGDWFLTPPFERMLDLMTASPGSIEGVRFFGLLTSGTMELLQPESGGTVWTDPSKPPDFTLPFDILESLTARGLTPFIALGFFPPAISPSPIAPPATFERWQDLITAFLERLAEDSRFGADSIQTWRFEVWNEPNEGRFWTGTFEQYLNLYRATSNAVRDSGLKLSLGGPAMAYKPESEQEDGPETLRRFLTFLRDEPDVQCDFISYHRKGTVDRSAPEPGRLWHASLEVEILVREIVPDRVSELEIINNEADEKIGFESPYPPRMDAFAASWLTTLASVTALRQQTQNMAPPLRHSLYPDNANLQLIEAPFDGRRSIYVPATNDDRTRLIKSSGAVWYDLLPLLSGALLQIDGESSHAFPATDLHIVPIRTETACVILATWYPVNDTDGEQQLRRTVELTDLTWERVNLIEFRIDSTFSNGYRASGGGPQNPAPQPESEEIAAIRRSQELTFRRPFDEPVEVRRGQISLSVDLEPFATSCFWITPVDPAPIEPPASVEIRWHDAEIDVTWPSVLHPQLLGYEVERIVAGSPAPDPVTLRPIRPTTVTDDRPIAQTTYLVRAVSASGNVSDWASVTVDP